MHYKFIMKRSFCILIAFVVTSVGVMADIQAPPGSTYTPTRKLGRALSNISWPWKFPNRWFAKQSNTALMLVGPMAVIDGYRRALKRFGYGWYELVHISIVPLIKELSNLLMSDVAKIIALK